MHCRGLREGVALRVPGGEALEGGERLVRDRGDRCDAGPDLYAVGEHRAGAALRESAAEARPLQLELVGEHVEERRISARLHRPSPSVHLDVDAVRHAHPPVKADAICSYFNCRLAAVAGVNKQHPCRMPTSSPSEPPLPRTSAITWP